MNPCSPDLDLLGNGVGELLFHVLCTPDIAGSVVIHPELNAEQFSFVETFCVDNLFRR